MLGLDFEVRPARIPEERRAGEAPDGHVVRLAREKAAAVVEERPGALVLAGDTVVVLDDRILGKPADEDDAVRMLLELSGRTHHVVSGLALAGADGAIFTGTRRTRIVFRPFGEAEARAYVATGEPLDKAGGYGIQARGGALVRRLDGDYYSVVGLPVTLFLDLLEAAGWCYRFDSLEPINPGRSP